MKKFIMVMGTISLLMVSAAIAGGLYNEILTPVDGNMTSYRRAASIHIDNTLGKSPMMEFTNEDCKLYPDGETVCRFARRVKLDSKKYAGKSIPLIHPETGAQIGATTPEEAYLMLYSLFVFAEEEENKFTANVRGTN